MGKEILLLLVMFWNVENFFDPFINNSAWIGTDSTSAPDYAFTPKGDKFWTWKKFAQKRDDIAKTVTLVKEGYGLFPALIGLCEVENRFVLQQLTQNSILAPLNYGIIHKDSPDRRGIDAALLYRKEEFNPLAVKFYPIKMEDESVGLKMEDAIAKDSVLQSRLMVYTKGVFRRLDTLHCFVVHWSSKLGGEKDALPRRMAASRQLKMVTDSILLTNSNANIVVMGDFNDGADSQPVVNLNNLVNMSLQGEKRHQKQVTYKYKESWSRIDHFLVSPGLFQKDNLSGHISDSTAIENSMQMKWLFCSPNSSNVFNHSFLLEEDMVYLGYKVRRTLVGPRYNGGVSDHLPIVLQIWGYDF